MSTPFTSGPWILDHQGPLSSNAYAVLSEKGWVEGSPWIAQVYGQNVGPCTEEETTANARLIAATPQMYAALKLAYESMTGNNDPFKPEVWEAAVNAVFAALAKAVQL